jgi:hypothetical protein
MVAVFHYSHVRLLDYVKPVRIIPNLIPFNFDMLNAYWRIIDRDVGALVFICRSWVSEVYSGTANAEKLWSGEGAEKSRLFFCVRAPDKWTEMVRLVANGE